MPAHVGFSALDWHYDTVAPELQAAVREANEDLASRDHTYDTFNERLRAVAAKLPGVVCDAVVEDGYRCVWLFRARGGHVSVEPAFAGDLPWDDAIESEDAILELDHDSEAELTEAARALAAEGGAGACVAAVAENRYLVRIEAGNVTIRKLEPAVDAALYARVYGRHFTPVPPPARDPAKRYDVPVYFKQEALDLVQAQAQRTDRSLSSIVQAAWAHARDAIRTDAIDVRGLARSFGGDRCKLTLSLGGDVVDELDAAAKRNDSPSGLIVMAALAHARDAIVKLPPA